jgi:uncharacterized HhH-GPD family protein
MPPLTDASISDVEQLEPFDFRWPDGTEHFESGWAYRLNVAGEGHAVRLGIGGRKVYGRERVHTVTWFDGAVGVEGVEADDYPATGALVSLLRRPDKKMIRTLDEVPADYAGFDVVDHRREVDAKWSKNSLGVKIREDDLPGWAVHAWIRTRQRIGAPDLPRPQAQKQKQATLARPELPPPPTLEKQAVAAAIIAHGNALAQSLGGGAARFTASHQANSLIHEDPFAYLVAVIADQGIKAERAWSIPFELKGRLGGFSAEVIAGDPQAVRDAFSAPPKLHRFVNQVADWIIAAAGMILNSYDGDASRIWSDKPTAASLRQRFDDFPGVGQKKAAMAVEILERDLHVPMTELSGSDIAYDIHVRRVFLRTGLAERDDVAHMVAIARTLHPDRPGELDNPAWDIGRRWCTAGTPDCPSCPLVSVCPRYIERGTAVRGI